MLWAEQLRIRPVEVFQRTPQVGKSGFNQASPNIRFAEMANPTDEAAIQLRLKRVRLTADLNLGLPVVFVAANIALLNGASQPFAQRVGVVLQLLFALIE